MTPMQNDFIGGLPPAEPEVVKVPEPHSELTDSPVGEGLVTPETETVTYADGVVATGVAPLPRVSPDGAPAIDASGLASQPSPCSDELAQGHAGPDFEALLAAEKLAHATTKKQLADAVAKIEQATAMGFRFGNGIHSGT